MSQSSRSAAPIAIIGIGCRFPGGIVDTASFWKVLAEGVDTIGEIPGDRFDADAYFDARSQTPGKSVVRRGGFVQQALQDFDAEFFGISRTHAERMDPQHRLLLETAWEAMEDAGIDAESLRGSPTSVYVGQWTSDFEHRFYAHPNAMDFQMTLGSGRYATAARVSHAFGFRAESLSLDTGCSAGLAAVHLAVRSLRNGDSTVALAAGVNVIMQPHIHVAYSQSGMMAVDGHCKFGDADGDGYVRSEGCGVVLLKPLDAAIADGDRIHAVIRGTAMNNDGDTGLSLGSPSGSGHEALIRKALADGDVMPADVAYVEAHGTGTRAGDPVEINAIANVIAEGRSRGALAFVGSVKTNLGHTESAAGLAGLIKSALMVQRGMIPASLHLQTPNALIEWDAIPLAIPRALQVWPSGYPHRVAGVSSLGIGGTNAHVVLSDHAVPSDRIAALRADTPLPHAAGPTVLILPISARSESALRVLASQYADLLQSRDFDDAMQLCKRAATRRTALSHRTAFVQPDVSALVAALRSYATGAPAQLSGVVHERSPRAVAFVAPGQGGQWPGMARQLFSTSPVFRAAFEACDSAARAFLDVSLAAQLHLERDDAGYVGDRIDVVQPTLVALAISYAAFLQSVGVSPAVVVGHSLGEVAAAAIAGALDVAQAMQVVCTRSALMQQVAGRGGMAVLELSAADTTARIAKYGEQLSIAAINSARSTVVSGDPVAVRALRDELEAANIFCRIVQVDVAAHSVQMAPLATELQRSLQSLHPRASHVSMTSTVLGAPVDGLSLDASYWARNLREPVHFERAIAGILASAVELFAELGPHGVLTQSIEQIGHSRNTDAVAVACGRRETPDMQTIHEAVASLWCAGAAVDWTRLLPGESDWKFNDASLPLYPWQRERFWLPIADIDSTDSRRIASAVNGDLLSSLYAQRWESAPLNADRRDALALTSNWIVVQGASEDADAIVTELRHRSVTASVVANLSDLIALLRSDNLRDNRSAHGTNILFLPAGDEEIAYSPVAHINTLQSALSESSSVVTPRLWWLTNGAHAIDDHTVSDAAAVRGALWGAARSVGAEHPQWWGGLIDVMPQRPADMHVARLVDQLLSGDGEQLVALRGEQRFVMRYGAGVPNSAKPFRWRNDAAYLLTGAFGGVAQQIAQEMVEGGVRRIILLSRTALPMRREWSAVSSESSVGQRIAAVRALELAGCAVHLMTVDVANERELRGALADYASDGFPEIAGVVHMAAEIDNRLTHTMTRESYDRALAAKLNGARVLDRVFPTLDLFVLSSSVSAVIAQPGMASYSAANAGCDALAAARRARGEHALSIQWAAWSGVGMHSGARQGIDVHALERQGIGSITPTDGKALFNALLQRSESVIAVVPIDERAFAAHADPSVRRLFSTPGSGRTVEQRAYGASQPPVRTEFAESLRDASALERKQLIDGLVTEALSATLRRPVGDIGRRRTFGSMGFDSLMGLALRNRLERDLQRPLSATLAWNYPTLEALVAHLTSLFDAPVESRHSEPTRNSAISDSDSLHGAAHDLASMIGNLGELSDDETARLLRASRAS